MFIVIFISIYIKNLKIENKLDTEETLKLVSEDDLKELIPVDVMFCMMKSFFFDKFGYKNLKCFVL